MASAIASAVRKDGPIDVRINGSRAQAVGMVTA